MRNETPVRPQFDRKIQSNERSASAVAGNMALEFTWPVSVGSKQQSPPSKMQISRAEAKSYSEAVIHPVILSKYTDRLAMRGGKVEVIRPRLDGVWSLRW